jgi:hypothetical protein
MKPRREETLTAEEVRALLDYCVESGEFTHKRRTPEMVVCKSDSDAERICASWNARYAGRPAGCVEKPRGYVLLRIYNRHYWGHRVAWLLSHGYWPVADVDHEDRDPRNNRLLNLRAATPTQNQGNKKKHVHNTSGLTGVSLEARTGKWVARIGGRKAKKHIGTFDCPAAARLAYIIEADKLFGGFASLL